jgi:hypothetical protein
LNEFVPATQWNEMLSQLKRSHSQPRGDRSPRLSLLSANPEHAATFDAGKLDSDFRIVVQNLNSDPTHSLSDVTVAAIATSLSDACFSDLDFVRESIRGSKFVGTDVAISDSQSDDCDLELELLESVQEISRYLCRTTARRVVSSDRPTAANS